MVAGGQKLAPQPSRELGFPHSAAQLGSAQRPRVLDFSLCSDVGTFRDLFFFPGLVQFLARHLRSSRQVLRPRVVLALRGAFRQVRVVYRSALGRTRTCACPSFDLRRVRMLSPDDLQKELKPESSGVDGKRSMRLICRFEQVGVARRNHVQNRSRYSQISFLCEALISGVPEASAGKGREE